MFCPAATLEAHYKTDTAAGPVNEHTNPDAQQSCMKAQHQHIAANHAEQPHTQNADCHRKTGVAAAAQGVRQCKAGSPEKNADDIEHPHNLYAAFRSGRRKRKQLGDFGNHRVQNQIEHRQPTAGHQHEQTCITMRLFFVPGPQTAPHYRGHRNADGRARQGRNTEGGNKSR